MQSEPPQRPDDADRPKADIKQLTQHLLTAMAWDLTSNGLASMSDPARPIEKNPLFRLLILHPAMANLLTLLVASHCEGYRGADGGRWLARLLKRARDGRETRAAQAQYLYMFGAVVDAIALQDLLLQECPSDLSPFADRARARLEAGLLSGSESDFRRALIADPTDARTAGDFARSLQAGDDPSWRILARRALLAEPGNRANQFRLAGLELRAAPNSPQSWQKFTARWIRPPYEVESFGVDLPRWRGPEDPARRLLVIQELEIGDQIYFAGFVARLAALSLSGTLVCNPRLQTLFERSFPGWQCVGALDEVTAENHDAQIMIGDLGQTIRQSERPGYLLPMPDLVARLRERYSGLAGGRALIGFTWRGGNDSSLDERRRHIPLSDFERLFENGRLQFVCLQHAATTQEHRFLSQFENVTVDASIDPLGDLDPFAAQIAAMDQVVTAASAAAHLTGALGTPALCLLPHLAHWQWGLGPTTAPCYPKLKSLRQSCPGDWQPILTAAMR